MRFSELIFSGSLMMSLDGNCFDLSKGIMENQLTPVYWLLENGYSPHAVLINGLLPLEHTFNNNLTEMAGLLTHFSPSINPIETSINFASFEDAEAIAYVHYHSWNVAYGTELPSKSLQERRNFWKELLISSPTDHKVLVLKLNSRVIAFCGYTHTNESVEIKGLYVHPAFQRMGAGKKILRHLISSLNAGTFLFLWVYEKNFNAILFYKKNGFEVSESENKKYPGTEKKLSKFELRV